MSKEKPTQESSDRDERGRFKPGNKIGQLKPISQQYQIMRKETREGVIRSARRLVDPIDVFKNLPEEEMTPLDGLIRKAINEGKFSFIQYIIDQAVGRAVTPVVAKTEGDVKPKAIIRRVDGSVVEYSLNDKESESNE